MKTKETTAEQAASLALVNGSPLPGWKPQNCIRRVRRAEKFGVNTCPSSRHVRMMGEVLARGGKYPMLEEEPRHCGVSLLVVVEQLFKARDEIRRLKTRANHMLSESHENSRRP